MNYIVVPEGVSASVDGKPLAYPSFVYRQVLDYLLDIVKSEDTVYLAPANDFGSGRYEQEVACDYLRERNQNINIVYPVFKAANYIDTCGNALHLKQFIKEEMDNNFFDLVCANIHSYRAEYCFKKSGFKVLKVHRVKYRIKKENIVMRLWYYKYRPVHVMYEGLAMIRELIKSNNRKVNL